MEARTLAGNMKYRGTSLITDRHPVGPYSRTSVSLHVRTPTYLYIITSLVRKRTPLEPYRRPMPRLLWGS